jgi:hypothetical protein
MGEKEKEMNKNNKRRRVDFRNPLSFLSCLSCLFLLLAGTAFPQSGGAFQIRRSVISPGGGLATGGAFSLDSTIGEPVAGT